jgi:hypothetical protein
METDTVDTLPDNGITHTLSNGRVYKLTDTGKPFVQGEYLSGGVVITAWEPRSNNGEGAWILIDYSPDMPTAIGFLRLAQRLSPL